MDVRLDLPLATLGSRQIAQWLDMMILGAAALILAFLGGAAITVAAVLDASVAPVVAASAVVLLFLLQWGYFFGFELAWQGQTPGKRAVGLRVVTDEGGPPGAVACLVRNLVRFLDLLPGTYGIGALAVFLSRRGKRLGDLAAGTVVIRQPPPSARPPLSWPAELAAADITLLERWRVRAPSLLPQARVELAAAMVERLRRTAPAVVPESSPERSADAVLTALCTPART